MKNKILIWICMLFLLVSFVSAIDTTGLIAYWPMEENAANQTDYSPVGTNYGNITGAAWTAGCRP